MEYRNFGRTGVKVSELCLGCMNFGGQTPEDESIDMIDYAIEQGMNFLDFSRQLPSCILINYEQQKIVYQLRHKEAKKVNMK